MSKLKHVLIAVLTDTHTHRLTHLQAARVREVGQNNCARHVLGIDSRTFCRARADCSLCRQSNPTKLSEMKANLYDVEKVT